METKKEKKIWPILVIILLVLLAIVGFMIYRSGVEKPEIMEESLDVGYYKKDGKLYHQKPTVETYMFFITDKNGKGEKTIELAVLGVIDTVDKTILPIDFEKTLNVKKHCLDFVNNKTIVIDSTIKDMYNNDTYDPIESLISLNTNINDLMCNIRIDHYGMIDVDTFVTIISDLGGVTIDTSGLTINGRSFAKKKFLVNETNFKEFFFGSDKESKDIVELRQHRLEKQFYKDCVNLYHTNFEKAKAIFLKDAAGIYVNTNVVNEFQQGKMLMYENEILPTIHLTNNNISQKEKICLEYLYE